MTKRAGSNAWLLSGWEIRSLGESGAGNVATTTTASKPATAQPARVSRDGEIVAQNPPDGNSNIRYSRAEQTATAAFKK